MNKEEKDLLLKDLCGRLPYEVKIYVPVFKHDETLEEIDIVEQTINGYKSQVKPYLRSLSSMTKEEENELYHDCGIISVDYYRRTTDIVALPNTSKVTDWYNKYHFDYRNLIEKDLAIEAPKGMYNI